MKKSAGILLYKKAGPKLMVLLAHPGGPFWKNKDLGVWSIPKGEFDDSENPLDAAIREFAEETGVRLCGNFITLEPVTLQSGKVVYAWALEGDFDPDALKSNTFETEWPPKSGTFQSFPEIDKAQWFTIDDALLKAHPAQARFVAQLVSKLTR